MSYPLEIWLESRVPFSDTLHKCRAHENLCVTEKKLGENILSKMEKKLSSVAPKRETCFGFFFLFFAN